MVSIGLTLVMLSLNALATLVPLLGGVVVIGSGIHLLFSRGQSKVVVYYVYIADSSLDCLLLGFVLLFASLSSIIKCITFANVEC